MTFVVAGKTKSPKSPSGWAVERAGRAKSNYNQSGLKLNLVPSSTICSVLFSRNILHKEFRLQGTKKFMRTPLSEF